MAPIKNEVWLVEGVGIVYNHIQCQVQMILKLPLSHSSLCCQTQQFFQHIKLLKNIIHMNGAMHERIAIVENLAPKWDMNGAMHERTTTIENLVPKWDMNGATHEWNATVENLVPKWKRQRVNVWLKKLNNWDYLGDVSVMFMWSHLTLCMTCVFSPGHTKIVQN